MPKLFAGTDEAGRGPVIGSLFMALVAADAETIIEFRRLGVRDSKLVAHKKRIALADLIKEKATHFEVIEVTANEIDTSSLKLNELEGAKIAQMINGFKADEVIVDCPTANLEYFSNFLKTLLQYEPKLIVENQADTNHTIAAAASILAKVARENQVAELKREWGDFGSGYPSDPKAKQWLKDYYAKNGHFPDIVRHKWSTVSAITGEKKESKVQKGLLDF